MKRLNLAVDEKTEGILNAARQKTGVSMTAYVQRSVALFAHIQEYVRKGYTLKLVSPDKKDVRELDIL